MSVYGGPDIVTNGLVLHLDPGNEKSYPRVNGPELVTNSLVTVAGDGQIFNVLRNASQSLILFPLGTGINGRTYQITWTVTAQRATTSATLRNGAVYSINFNRTPGTYTATFTATATGTFGIYGDNTGTDFDLDYVSIKEIINSDGTTLYDLSGNNNHATLLNGPTFNINNNGRIVFDGSNDTITSPIGSSLTSVGSGDFAMSLWFNSTKTSRGDLISWKAADASYDIGIILNGSTNGTMQLYYKTPTGGAGFYSSFAYTSNSINHIHFQKKNNNVEMYLNGLQIHSTSAGGSVSNHPENLIYVASNRGTVNFQGSIYVTNIYTKSFSNNEILQNYNAIKGRYRL